MIDVASPYLVLKQFVLRSPATLALTAAAALGFGALMARVSGDAAAAFAAGAVIGPCVLGLLFQLSHRSMNTAADARAALAAADAHAAEIERLRAELAALEERLDQRVREAEERGEYSYRALELALLSEEGVAAPAAPRTSAGGAA